MEFLISKTSDYSGNSKPHKRAFRKEFVRIDERHVESPDKLTYRNAELEWHHNGYNHRKEDGHIKRDFRDNGWFIEVNSLEELLDLQKSCGSELVVSNSYMNELIPEIEIYDDYRE